MEPVYDKRLDVMMVLSMMITMIYDLDNGRWDDDDDGGDDDLLVGL